MRNKLIASLVAGSMLLGSTAAMADTRPRATRFTQPAASSQDGVGKSGAGGLLLIGGLTAAAIAAIIAAASKNSPHH